MMWLALSIICLIFKYIDCSCQWVGPISNKGLPLNGTHIIEDIPVYKCWQECEQETSFTCVSVEYHRWQKYCILRDQDRHSMVLIESRSMDYFERKCTDPCEDLGECNTGLVKPQVISVFSKLCLCDCIFMCQNQEDFHCTSMKYLSFSKKCTLGQSSQRLVPAKIRPPSTMDKCFPWTDGICDTQDCVNAGLWLYTLPYNCYMVKDEGECTEIEERWYYNYDLNICQKFEYSGCGGNDNNFVSLYRCKHACIPQDV